MEAKIRRRTFSFPTLVTCTRSQLSSISLASCLESDSSPLILPLGFPVRGRHGNRLTATPTKRKTGCGCETHFWPRMTKALRPIAGLCGLPFPNLRAAVSFRNLCPWRSMATVRPRPFPKLVLRQVSLLGPLACPWNPNLCLRCRN